MTERERLVELLKRADDKCASTKQCENCVGFGKGADCVDFLFADHLLANGVIVPPCKVGDTVYKVVNDKRVKKPYECKVVGFLYSEYKRCNDVHLVRYVNDVFVCSFSVPFTEFGKTVFLTRKEAEKALAEREQK